MTMQTSPSHARLVDFDEAYAASLLYDAQGAVMAATIGALNRNGPRLCSTPANRARLWGWLAGLCREAAHRADEAGTNGKPVAGLLRNDATSGGTGLSTVPAVLATLLSVNNITPADFHYLSTEYLRLSKLIHGHHPHRFPYTSQANMCERLMERATEGGA